MGAQPAKGETPAGPKYRVADGRGDWVVQTTGRESWAAPRARELERAGGRGVRVLSARLGDWQIQLGSPMGEYEELVEGFTWMGVLAGMGGCWMSGRAMAPVDGITQAVRDTGPGIAGEDLPHIFDRSCRAGTDRSRQAGGTGLGLSMEEWIAERHGGTVRVESEVGAGSTCALRLPVE